MQNIQHLFYFFLYLLANYSKLYIKLKQEVKAKSKIRINCKSNSKIAKII